jgi:hypothetical protein
MMVDTAFPPPNVINDANLLRHLLDATDDAVFEMEFPVGGRNELERIAALIRIARDLAGRLSVDIAGVFHPADVRR